jgi:RNA-directed DNA polymerase
MKALKKHTDNKWVERWLKTPIGVMQGEVISPCLHYVFDIWMLKHHSTTPWCRYAADGLAHCKTESQAQK